MKIVAIIQARLTSSRFPRKVLEKVNGKSMISRVCEAARNAKAVDKVVVAWAHKFPNLDEDDVWSRFVEIVKREEADVVVRLTSDCPLLTSKHIDWAIDHFLCDPPTDYYCNGLDGFDVQVFYPEYLYENGHREHVIADFGTPSTGLSVNTPADLERVRGLCETK